MPATGAPEPVGLLSELTETIDFVNGRAAFDNTVQLGDGFTQHRTEAYTSYLGANMGWGTTEGRPNQVTSVDGLFSWATHNSPEILLRRNPVSIALSAVNVDPAAMAEARELDGAPSWFVETSLNGESIGLYIDPATSLMRGFSALDTESMWGDTNAIYVYSDWRPVAAVVMPFALEIRKEDGVYASLSYDEISIDDSSALAIFDIPPDVTEQADQVRAMGDESWVPLQWNAVTDEVTHAVAFSHHSMVVEFPTFVVVVEGAYTEGQSLTLARMIDGFIGKPIRYVIPTHPHFDHTGGVRALASLGANVLTAAGHEAEIRHIVESPHSNPPDALARNISAGMQVGQVEVFSESTEISEGNQRIQLYEVHGIPHVDPKVLVYVPSSRVLFQSDLFFGAPGLDATALYIAILELGLDVDRIVGGHGGVLTFSSLESAINGTN